MTAVIRGSPLLNGGLRTCRLSREGYAKYGLFQIFAEKIHISVIDSYQV